MNVEKLFDTLSKILSEKENAKINFIVKEKEVMSDVMCEIISASD